MEKIDIKLFAAYKKATEQTDKEARGSLLLIGLHRWHALSKYSKSDKGKRAVKKAHKGQTAKRSKARKTAKETIKAGYRADVKAGQKLAKKMREGKIKARVSKPRKIVEAKPVETVAEIESVTVSQS